MLGCWSRATASASARKRSEHRRARVAAGQDHLEGHGPVEPDLPRLVDDAHAAPAQLAHEVIARHPRGLRFGPGAELHLRRGDDGFLLAGGQTATALGVKRRRRGVRQCGRLGGRSRFRLGSPSIFCVADHGMGSRGPGRWAVHRQGQNTAVRPSGLAPWRAATGHLQSHGILRVRVRAIKKTTTRQWAKNQPKTEVPAEGCPQSRFREVLASNACKPRTQPQDSPVF